jgi:N-acetylglutamate synthase-like GNAT family acetyltransferase
MNPSFRGTKTANRQPVRMRRAEPRDYADIETLMGALELSYPTMDFSFFWVAETGNEVVAAAELKDFQACSLLSCVGVREDLQGLDIGRALVEEVVRHARHDVYLYTLVPDFFRKAGFAEAGQAPLDLPPRSIYGCQNCSPGLCCCMVRLRHDS